MAKKQRSRFKSFFGGDGSSWADQIKGAWTGGLYGSPTTSALSDFWRGPQRYGQGYYSPRSNTAFSVSGVPNVTVLGRYLQKLRGTTRLVIKPRRGRKKVSVSWGSSSSDNYFDPEQDRIVLSSQPLADENVKLSEGQRLDVVTSTALHEAAHAEYTKMDEIEQHFKDDGITKTQLMHFAFNLVEDGFIEAKVRESYPGFAPYFDAGHNYYIDEATEDRVRKRLGLYLNNVDPMEYPIPIVSSGSLEGYDIKNVSYGTDVSKRLAYIMPIVIATSMAGIKGIDDQYEKDDVLYRHMLNRRKIDIDGLASGKPLERFVHSHLVGIASAFRRCEDPSKTIKDRYTASREVHDRIYDLVKGVTSKTKQEMSDQAEEDLKGGNPCGFGEGDPPEFDSADLPSHDEDGGVTETIVEQAFVDNGVNESVGKRRLKVKIYESSIEQDRSRSAPQRPFETGAEPINEWQASSTENIAQSRIDYSTPSGYPNDGSTLTDSSKLLSIDVPVVPWAISRYRAITREMRPYERSLVRALKFRSSSKVFTERDRPHGKLDTTRLADFVGMKSKDIFQKTIVAKAPSAHVAILVDESGSMGNAAHDMDRAIDRAVSKSTLARASAIALANALEKIPEVTYEVWGHTESIRSSRRYGATGNDEVDESTLGPILGLDHDGPVLMRYVDSRFNFGDVRSMARMTGRSGNVDAVAIKAVGDSIMKKPGEKNLLIVLCDGLPGDIVYSTYDSPDAHVKAKVTELRRKGVDVVSLFIGRAASYHRMDDMYGPRNKKWFHVAKPADLPSHVKRIAEGFLRWEGS